MKSALLGILVGFLVAAAAVAIAGWRLASRRSDAVRSEWEPVEVLVAARDLPENAKLADGDLAIVSLPSQFVTASVVRPAARETIVGRRLRMPLQVKDVLAWQALVDTHADETAACSAAVVPHYREAVEAVTQREVADVVAHLAAPAKLELPEPSGLEVVVLARDLAEGDRVQPGDLSTRPAPAELVTPSAIPAADLRRLVNATAIAPMQKGDIARWQFFDDAEHPQTAEGCASRVAGAAKRAGEAAAHQGAADYFAGKEAH